MCFRESAENTKLLKRSAHPGDTDDTGLLIQNASQPHTVNSQAAIGGPLAWLEIRLKLYNIFL